MARPGVKRWGGQNYYYAYMRARVDITHAHNMISTNVNFISSSRDYVDSIYIAELVIKIEGGGQG